MAKYKGITIRAFTDKSKFEAWLSDNHAACDEGLWVKFAKKGTGKKTISYEDAREVAICFGWIDGLKNRIDETYYALRFTPRRPRSRWSQINREIAEGLIERKQMRPAGRREVEAARADGRWDAAYPSQSTITVPDDLERALAESPKAKRAFADISRAGRFAILYGIHDARRADTRARRIAKYVAMLERGEVPHPGH